MIMALDEATGSFVHFNIDQLLLAKQSDDMKARTGLMSFEHGYGSSQEKIISSKTLWIKRGEDTVLDDLLNFEMLRKSYQERLLQDLFSLDWRLHQCINENRVGKKNTFMGFSFMLGCSLGIGEAYRPEDKDRS